MMNVVVVVGTLTRDPDVKEIKSGMIVGKLNVMMEHEFKERKEKCYIDCTVWGSEAERCQAFLKKNSRIAVRGRLKLESWVDKNSGEERSRHVIATEKIMFIDEEQEEMMSVPEVKPKQQISYDEMPF